MKSIKQLLALLLAPVLICGLIPRALAAPVPAEYPAGDVTINAANFPDSKFRAFVSEELDANHNGRLSDAERNAVKEIYCCDRDIQSLQGVGFFPALETLDCSGNQLKTLDLRQNTALVEMYCNDNRLTSLDLSKNAALYMLYCYNNPLTKLDLRPVPALNYTVSSYRWKELPPYNNDYPVYDHYVDFKGLLGVDSGVELKVNVTPFTDVQEGKYYYKPVYWAYYNIPQITGGSSATLFSPANDCTREQIVTFLWKSLSAPEPTTTQNPFSDVKSGKYYYKAVLWAKENNITDGIGGGKFGVGQSCTREQAVTFLWKTMGSPKYTGVENQFTDVKSNKYYYYAVLWAVVNGVTGGVSESVFGVGQTCTRAQILTFLYKLYH